MDNMHFYNLGRSVPNEAKKPITAGRLKGFTDINPMWRIKRLTEMFGPCGIGWWYVIRNKEIRYDDITNQAAAFIDIDLYFVEPESGETSKPIPGTGGSAFVVKEKNGPYLSDECFKMALTDAISVAAKSIGIGADVYFSADRSKYTNIVPDTQPEAPKDTKFRCTCCGKELVPYPGKSGEMVSLRAHSERSIRIYGTTLCLDCIKLKEEEAVTE